MLSHAKNLEKIFQISENAFCKSLEIKEEKAEPERFELSVTGYMSDSGEKC